MGLHALRRAASLSEPLRRSKASSQIQSDCTQPGSGMVYKWGGTDRGERCPRCPRTSAADMGVEMVGHDLVTEHAGAPNLTQGIT